MDHSDANESGHTGSSFAESSYSGDSTFRNRVATYVGSSLYLGYTNITRIKDLFDELKAEVKEHDVTREDERESDVPENDSMDRGKKNMEPSSSKNPVPGFPATVDELLKKVDEDRYKSIDTMEHQYLCGCLDVLYAVRKSYFNGKIPMTKKLCDILTVKELDQTSQRQPDSPKSSIVPKKPSHRESEHDIHPKSSNDHSSTSRSSQSPPKVQSEKRHHERDNAPIGNSHKSPSSKYKQTSDLVPRPTHSGGLGLSSSASRSLQDSYHSPPSTWSRDSTYTCSSSLSANQSHARSSQSTASGGSLGSYNSRSSQSTSSKGLSNFFWSPKQPKQIPITVVSNKINGMTDVLLQGFIRSLNTADVIYNVNVLEPQHVQPSQRCIMGCVSASRVLSDVNAALALFPGQKPVQLIMAVLHPKASHVPLHVTTDQKLGPVPGVNAFCDIVFWDGQIYPCPMNERAKANFQQLFQG